ncbi:hypothetical protein FGO68_gene9919 [Halteria grandinella]|uniref:histidine kinase n=1 Tax=Halteria grandinella TaxID=5974 RepID=A0A8J8P2P1_HALGN|nr:hypothetical protein FGO68_gene9919 [Halteria grandinella]
MVQEEWLLHYLKLLLHRNYRAADIFITKKIRILPSVSQLSINSFRKLVFLAQQEFLELAMGTSYFRKKVHRIIYWAYYIARNYIEYGSFPILMIMSVMAFIFAQQFTAQIYENFLQKLHRHAHEIQESFNSTLNLIPNGIMIIEVSSKSISFINKEMKEFLNFNDIKEANAQVNVKERVQLFVQKESISSEYLHTLDSASSSVRRSASTQSGDSQVNEMKKIKQKGIASSLNKNLWEVIVNLKQYKQSERVDSIFKSQSPRRYIQVRSQLINNGTQIMAICTDITRLKDVEAQARQMRSSFFSSIAHELRTPLNSVIPILKLVQSFLSAKGPINVEKIIRFINIALNSSMHLENVIEDALDISRLENNKFQMFKETFEVRDCVKQVLDIMKFQVEQKGLVLQKEIGREVPMRIQTDQKRLKQVLFNLLGNAIKFTFQGIIKIGINFDEQNQALKVKVIDTGVGIQPEDQNKLFKFFGCLTKTKDINRGGMGLGLTISKMIVQQLGGEIKVKSTPQVGSEFSFWIPVENNVLFPEIICEDFQELEQTMMSLQRERKSSWSPQSKGDSPKNRKFADVNINVKEQIGKRIGRQSKSPNLTKNDANKQKRILIQKIISKCEPQFNDENNSNENIVFTNADNQSMQNIRDKEKTIADMYLQLQEQSCVPRKVMLSQEHQICTEEAERPNRQLVILKNSQPQIANSSTKSIAKNTKIRVLCVDDSPNNLFVLEETIKSLCEEEIQAEITTALNGKIALDLIKNSQGQTEAAALFDLILMDLQMPVLNGFQVRIKNSSN